VAVALAVVLGALLAACSGGGGDDGDGDGGRTTTDHSAGAAGAATPPAPTEPTPAPHTVPGADWATVAPTDVGLDPGVLDELAAAADASGSSCLVVVRDGRVADEWYFGGVDPDAPREVFSVTKSITSVLAGVARDRGDLALDDPASNWIEAWRGTTSEAVTVADLLGNDSGRTWTEAGNWRDLIVQPDQTTYAVGLGQQDPPGAAWRYDNSAIQALDPVLEGAVGSDVAAWADEVLFDPIGMERTEMAHDQAGNTLTYAWARSTCRDLARFGLLVLRGGDWGGRRIVAEEWIEASTGEPSTDLTASYGYLWWLNLTDASSADPTAPDPPTGTGATGRNMAPVGQVVPGAPTDLVWAQGLGNQLVQVHPGTDTVLVRLSGDREAEPGAVFDPVTASRLVTEAVVGPPS
jgi:CubicO group peptidase (beta-lactamase class C family)